jgi:Ca-activated chloride channel family protein
VLNVNVQDPRGAWVGGLGKGAFAVFEDGTPQEVSLFVAEDSPVTIGVLVDNSISMRENRDLVVAAAGQLAEASHPDDELFALAFNEAVLPVLPPGAPFTSDPSILRRALDRTISARGRTAFFDAVDAGLAYAAKGAHQRRVLVVISDGGDNASQTTFDAVLKRAQAANVMVHAVALVDPLDREANPGRLRELARVTGGATFTPRTPADIPGVLTTIANDIRHTYLVGYRPARAPDGAYRSLRVIVTPPAGGRVVVRTRAGYVADASQAAERDGNQRR